MSEHPLHRELRLLYNGRSERAKRFRYALIVFDVASILYFIVAAALPYTTPLTVTNAVLGVIIFADFLARLWVAPDRLQMLRRIYTIADIIVLVSLFVAPFVPDDITFLRILRGLRLLHSYHLVHDLRRDSDLFRRHEDTFLAGMNLFVFIFVTSSLAFALFFEAHTGVTAYIDALYFTVATLTTTGFGDITLDSPGGKLFSVLVMVVGVALFVQFARALFQPKKVKYTCQECGLNRHDPDAVHCKHCGAPVKIPTHGFSD
ncbi:potassium channel family protein [Pararhodobacter zhoushanensis]|uniref:potassium channel family protein n=1 Tax=Pararhodobacter zhoushanensis TaxID=2479545 RepID=UPI001FE49B0C|nr:potassium channel family protein [Pararhodobacter zhoushanensis]